MKIDRSEKLLLFDTYLKKRDSENSGVEIYIWKNGIYFIGLSVYDLIQCYASRILSKNYFYVIGGRCSDLQSFPFSFYCGKIQQPMDKPTFIKMLEYLKEDNSSEFNLIFSDVLFDDKVYKDIEKQIRCRTALPPQMLAMLNNKIITSHDNYFTDIITEDTSFKLSMIDCAIRSLIKIYINANITAIPDKLLLKIYKQINEIPIACYPLEFRSQYEDKYKYKNRGLFFNHNTIELKLHLNNGYWLNADNNTQSSRQGLIQLTYKINTEKWTAEFKINSEF